MVSIVMFRRLAINGKFLTAGPTGVHRVAKQLLGELANHRGELAEIFDESPRLIAPSSFRNKAPPVFEVERGGIFRGQLWEQLDLPRLSRPDLLLNLCNLGPVASRFAITMIHDAQVFITSDSYSWAFANWYRRVLPAIGHRHSRILTVSEFSANQLAQYGVAPRERITVIPNGVDHLLACDSDPEIRSRLDLVSRKFVVGLANVQVHKNIGLLLKAFEAPALADLRLVLVGTASRAQFELLGHPVSPERSVCRSDSRRRAARATGNRPCVLDVRPLLRVLACRHWKVCCLVARRSWRLAAPCPKLQERGLFLHRRTSRGNGSAPFASLPTNQTTGQPILTLGEHGRANLLGGARGRSSSTLLKRLQSRAPPNINGIVNDARAVEPNCYRNR